MPYLGAITFTVVVVAVSLAVLPSVFEHSRAGLAIAHLVFGAVYATLADWAWGCQITLSATELGRLPIVDSSVEMTWSNDREDPGSRGYV